MLTDAQREAAIERAAAVIHDEAWESGDRPHKWADDESRTSRIIARRQAAAALAAFADAGFVVTPKACPTCGGTKRVVAAERSFGEWVEACPDRGIDGETP